MTAMIDTLDNELVGRLNPEIDLPISSLMNTEIVSAPVTSTIRRAAELLDHEGIGLLILGEPGEVRGVLSERDIVRIVASGLSLDNQIERAGGQAELCWAPATATAGEVARAMMERYVRHVLIADEEGALAGVVSMRDLLAVLLS